MGDVDMKKLSLPPKFLAKSYPMMEAYVNHYRCDDESSIGMVNCGVIFTLSA